MSKLNDKKIKDKMANLMTEVASNHRERIKIEERAEQIWLELSDRIKNGSFKESDTEEMRDMGEIYLEKCTLVESERNGLISKMLLLVLER